MVPKPVVATMMEKVKTTWDRKNENKEGKKEERRRVINMHTH